jgi:Fur family ferric uptake transcriptional regulator
MKDENYIFSEFIRAEGLKSTSQRSAILEAFLKMEDHVSVDDIYRSLRLQRQRVGYATVYRTMKLIAQCGLAREVRFDDGVSRFERKNQQDHHHHLVCTKCGKVTEFSSRAMDAGESEILKKHAFEMQYHRYEIFGLCRTCSISNGKDKK